MVNTSWYCHVQQQKGKLYVATACLVNFAKGSLANDLLELVLTVNLNRLPNDALIHAVAHCTRQSFETEERQAMKAAARQPSS